MLFFARPGRVTRALLLAFAAACSVAAVACGPSEEPREEPCVNVTVQCKPIVSPPTFDALYANIFSPSCASGTGRCHGEGFSAELDMRSADAAYGGLSARVKPDDLGCSLLLKRVESSNPSFRMPPGSTSLSEAQRCAIRQWIANGAKR